MGLSAETLHAGPRGSADDSCAMADRRRRTRHAASWADAAARLRSSSGLALMAGSACTRFGVFEAGQASARDPKYTVVPQRERLEQRSTWRLTAARRSAGGQRPAISDRRTANVTAAVGGSR